MANQARGQVVIADVLVADTSPWLTVCLAWRKGSAFLGQHLPLCPHHPSCAAWGRLKACPFSVTQSSHRPDGKISITPCIISERMEM